MIVPELEPFAVELDRLQLLEGNPRRGDVEAVARSYTEFGQRKPIVARQDGTIIDGNHQFMAAKQLGWEKIAVVFVDDDDIKAKAYALAANRTSELGDYNNDHLLAMLEVVASDAALLEASGFDDDDIVALATTGALAPAVHIPGSDDTSDSTNQHDYTMATNVPQYNIVGEQPKPSELFDASKQQQLTQCIENTPNIPEDVRKFLLQAAHRHVRFNYRKIAEFYPHATAEVQRLMEASALVIIDFDDAMREGFVKLYKAFDALRQEAEYES